MNLKEIAEGLVNELKLVGVDAYIWHAATTGSAYIRFDDNRIGSVRLGDHAGRKKLKYKWNIRTDFPKNHKKWHKVEGMWRFYIHVDKWKEIIPLLVDRKNEVATWDKNKYSYFIPHFKK